MKAIAHKEENRTTAALISIVLHAIILALLLFVTTNGEKPLVETPAIELQWGGGGDNAALGSPDAGRNDRPAGAGQPVEQPKAEAPVEKPAPAPKKTTPPPAKSKPAVNNPKRVATTQDPNAAAIRDAQRAQDQQRKTESDARLRQEAERQRQAQEAADLARRTEEDRQNKKAGFGSAFGGDGNGAGAGNGGKAGNQGRPDGDGDNPFGKSPGTGGGRGGGSGTGDGVSIGGGLAGRKVIDRPVMKDNTQKIGVIMLSVCVDGDGNVIKADYTLRGSTTNDGELRSKAIQWAKQHRFAPSAREKECGTFAFSFRVQ